MESMTLAKVKYLRTSLNLNRREFADKLGITPQYWSNVENGKIKLSMKMLRNICDAVGCTMEYLTLDSVPIDKPDYSFDDIEPSPPSFVEELEKLSLLYNKGLLTPDEFKKAKAKLING